MIEAFQSIKKLKQLKIVNVLPEFSQTNAKVTFYAIFSSKMNCKFEILLNTYNINQEQNKFLSKLAKAENVRQFQSIVNEKLCEVSADKNIYMPFFNQQKWQESVT